MGTSDALHKLPIAAKVPWRKTLAEERPFYVWGSNRRAYCAARTASSGLGSGGLGVRNNVCGAGQKGKG